MAARPEAPRVELVLDRLRDLLGRQPDAALERQVDDHEPSAGRPDDRAAIRQPDAAGGERGGRHSSRRPPTLTHTPSGPAATPRGCEPTRTGASTRRARVSMRATTPRSGFAATTCPPDATSVTPAPTS